MRLIRRGICIAPFGLLALGMTALELAAPALPQAERGRYEDGCRSCHVEILAGYVDTAHFRTSAESDRTVLGPVPVEVNTSRPTTRFRVERRKDGVHQIADWVDAGRARTRSERIDLVIGSGRRGQSYLYWRDGLLYQLPLSYLVLLDRWVNSPGYVDGEVHFDRLIPPRCLECHATSFRVEGAPPRLKYAAEYGLGLACEICHERAAGRRAARQADGPVHSTIVNPAKLTRQQQIDLCGVCHAGAEREPRRQSFTFVPGERLVDHLGPLPEPDVREPDVHGSQVALLEASRCFQASDVMTCSTCHDVHRTERDVKQLSNRCLGCHPAQAAGGKETSVTAALRERQPRPGGGATATMCVDCHMPLRPSRLIRIAVGGTTFAPSYRTHRIAIYRSGGDAAARFHRGDRQ